jgi:zinc transport system substrate-binding protein
MTLLNYDDDEAEEHEEHHHDEQHDEADHDGDEHHDADDHEHHHDHHGLDAHIWLDPANARAMVTAIVATLSKVDPDNAATYSANGESISARLVSLEEATNEQLAPYRKAPYFTFHESFRYFDNRFGLNGLGAITVSPEQKPGVQRLKEIRAEILEFYGVCLFAEPQFPPRLVDVIVEGTDAKTGTIDPLGASLDPGSDLYFKLIESNRNSLINCFSATN